MDALRQDLIGITLHLLFRVNFWKHVSIIPCDSEAKASESQAIIENINRFNIRV